MLRILTQVDYLTVPWKNGRGTTTEIARHPRLESANPDFEFAWRVSMAPVLEDGPFSAFPGISRTIAVVEGAGMDLHFDSGAHQRVLPLRPYSFDGSAPVSARLIGGPVRDFNVMVRAGAGYSALAVVRHADHRNLSAGATRTVLLHILTGDWHIAASATMHRLEPGFTALQTAGEDRPQNFLSGEGCALLVELPVAPARESRHG